MEAAGSARAAELNTFLLNLLPPGDSDKSLWALYQSGIKPPSEDKWITFDELWGKTDTSHLPPLLAFLYSNKAQGKLCAAPRGKEISVRAGWLQVPSNRVMKQMLFTYGDQNVFVITSGTNNVFLSFVQKALNLPTPGSLARSCAVIGCNMGAISPFCTTIPAYLPANNVPTPPASNPPPLTTTTTSTTASTTPTTPTIPTNLQVAHTVLNQEVLDLGLDTEVYLSAGCENVYYCMTVREIVRMLGPHTITTC